VIRACEQLVKTTRLADGFRVCHLTAFRTGHQSQHLEPSRHLLEDKCQLLFGIR
jgi:hypothetical protein